jgi:GT2 family glycosyltransferase
MPESIQAATALAECPVPAPAAHPSPRKGAADNDAIDVSVCIVNWNCRDLLRRCLASLHSQRLRLETIVVDNASADGAADMVAREFPEVVLIRNACNVGFARANNQAAQRARGRYLFFLNNDTIVPPGVLRRLLHYAEAHPEVGMVGPRLRDGDGRFQVSYRLLPTLPVLLHRTSLLRWTGLFRRAYRRYRRQEFDPQRTRRVEMLMGAALFLPRAAFFHCGPWDEAYTFGGEDLDLCTRVARHYALVFLPTVEITHFGRVSTRQHIGFAFSHMTIGFLRYLRSSGSSPAALALYKTLVTLDAPVKIVGKALEYLWRRLLGRQAKAFKTRTALQGHLHFLLHGLVPFWRA